MFQMFLGNLGCDCIDKGSKDQGKG